MSFDNVLPANADTLLTISSFGNMLYQARGLSQSLTVIAEASQMERTINGVLVDLSAAQFRKYASKITAPSDVLAPPIDGVFPGQTVTVECACSIAYITGSPGMPNRPEVSGSSHAENGYTFYRPQLTMKIKSVEMTFDEWKNVIGWTLDLEEV